MMLRLTKLELIDCGQWPRLEVDLHARTVIKGKNAEGKSTIIRAVMCLVGAGGESAQAMVRTDEHGVPIEGAVARIYGWLEGDGEKYKISREGKDLKLQHWEASDKPDGGSWRTLSPPDKELRRIFDRDSSPSALLDERLSDDRRVALILEVAEASGYDRDAVFLRALEAAETYVFTLLPIPAGLHPLEDLEKVLEQVFRARTDVERQRKAAASAAERLATGLTAEAPSSVVEKIQEAQALVDRLREAQARTDSQHKANIASARADADERIRSIEAEFHAECQRMREITGKLAEETTEAIMRATRTLAELRTTQEIVVADKARRDESEKARAEAQALAARHAALTRAIQSLKTQAAQFISDSFPGVKVDITEEGKRLLMVNGDNGWKPWRDTNTGRLQEIAAAWSVLHQEKRGAQGVPQLGLVLLDRGESLDPVKIDALGAAGQLIVTLRTPGELSFEEA